MEAYLDSSRKRGCVLSLRGVVLLSRTIGPRRGNPTARCPGNLRVRIGGAGNWDTLQDELGVCRLRVGFLGRRFRELTMIRTPVIFFFSRKFSSFFFHCGESRVGCGRDEYWCSTVF